VVDPASIEAPRRARRSKTDRIDLGLAGHILDFVLRAQLDAKLIVETAKGARITAQVAGLFHATVRSVSEGQRPRCSSRSVAVALWQHHSHFSFGLVAAVWNRLSEFNFLLSTIRLISF
jgi:hypothetical protein